MSVNKVILVGNLGKDPEVRYTPSGAAIASFSMATSEVYKDKDGNKQEKTEWHNVIAWRQLAEICGKFLHKGKQIYIEGKIQTRNYDDKDGNKRYITEIVADQMQMLGSKDDGQGQDRQSSGQQNRPQQNSGQQNRPQNGGNKPQERYDDTPDFNDDQIPF